MCQSILTKNLTTSKNCKMFFNVFILSLGLDKMLLIKLHALLNQVKSQKLMVFNSQKANFFGSQSLDFVFILQPPYRTKSYGNCNYHCTTGYILGHMKSACHFILRHFRWTTYMFYLSAKC